MRYCESWEGQWNDEPSGSAQAAIVNNTSLHSIDGQGLGMLVVKV